MKEIQSSSNRPRWKREARGKGSGEEVELRGKNVDFFSSMKRHSLLKPSCTSTPKTSS